MRIGAILLFLAWGLSALGQELSGIGVALARDGDDLIVRGVIPDSPAAASKAIHPGDRLIAVAQANEPPVNLAELGESALFEAVRMIRGPKGSKVSVTIVPAGKADTAARVVHLVRGDLKGLVQAVEFGQRLQPTAWLISLGLALSGVW